MRAIMETTPRLAATSRGDALTGPATRNGRWGVFDAAARGQSDVQSYATTEPTIDFTLLRRNSWLAIPPRRLCLPASGLSRLVLPPIINCTTVDSDTILRRGRESPVAHRDSLSLALEYTSIAGCWVRVRGVWRLLEMRGIAGSDDSNFPKTGDSAGCLYSELERISG